ECECFVQSETAPSWAVCSQPIPDFGVDARGISQSEQQIFLEILAEVLDNLGASLRIEVPVVIKAKLERRIMPGCDEKVQLPVVDIGGGGLLQPETEGKTGILVRPG